MQPGPTSGQVIAGGRNNSQGKNALSRPVTLVSRGRKTREAKERHHSGEAIMGVAVVKGVQLDTKFKMEPTKSIETKVVQGNEPNGLKMEPTKTVETIFK